MIKKDRAQRRERIKVSIRKRIYGTPERPRLTVYRSLNDIYGQIIDDVSGRTLVSVSSISKEVREEVVATKTKVAKSTIIGKLLAKKAIEKNIATVVFDRNGYLYHGRVKALAEGAREGGLKF
ncbi:MAG: 50S ribosomal protein L18 [Ignavibacteriales bacterium]|nr:50S ribosomal protein L18 [Ignavibacteriales bacterium]